MPTLVVLTPLLLPACHNVNRFVASFLFLYRDVFSSSHRILYRVKGAKTKDTTAAFKSLRRLHHVIIQVNASREIVDSYKVRNF